MKSINELLPFIMPELSGCPAALARSALLRAAIQFCEDSQGYIATLDPMALVGGTHTYEVETPSSQSRLLIIKEISFGATEVLPKTMGQLAGVMPNWRTATGNAPVFYSRPSSTEIRLHPAPNSDATGDVQIRAAFAPIRTADYLDDDLVNLSFEAIGAGAKWILMLMPGKPWSNPQLAEYYHSQFLAEIDKARIDAEHDFTQGSIYVQPRSFG